MAKFRLVSEESSDIDSDGDEETMRFTAEAHINHIGKVFEMFGIQNYKEWLINQTADNAAVNIKVSKILGIPHVACKSRCLNLEINLMCRDVTDLNNCIKSVHQMMAQCKGRLTTAALLRNISSLKPILHNKTRWSRKFFMLNRFAAIRDDLIEVSHRDNLEIDESPAFGRKVDRYQRQFYHMNHPKKFL